MDLGYSGLQSDKPLKSVTHGQCDDSVSVQSVSVMVVRALVAGSTPGRFAFSLQPWASCSHIRSSVTKQHNLVPVKGRRCPAAGRVPNYTAWWQRNVRVNNLPKVVSWKRNGQESNPRPTPWPPLHVQAALTDCTLTLIDYNDTKETIWDEHKKQRKQRNA